MKCAACNGKGCAVCKGTGEVSEDQHKREHDAFNALRQKVGYEPVPLETHGPAKSEQRGGVSGGATFGAGFHNSSAPIRCPKCSGGMRYRSSDKARWCEKCDPAPAEAPPAPEEEIVREAVDFVRARPDFPVTEETARAEPAAALEILTDLATAARHATRAVAEKMNAECLSLTERLTCSVERGDKLAELLVRAKDAVATHAMQTYSKCSWKLVEDIDAALGVAEVPPPLPAIALEQYPKTPTSRGEDDAQ